MQIDTLSSYKVRENWLIGASSHFIDRVVADCECIRLPEKNTEPGEIRFWRGALVDQIRGKGSLPWKSRFRSIENAPSENTFDLRNKEPQNWAHFLNNHLPLVFRICDRMAIDIDSATFILPKNTPKYIDRLTKILGLTTIQTDSVFHGQGVLYDVSPWISIRGERHLWVSGETSKKVMRRGSAPTENRHFPSKVFISRKDTRRLLNESEVKSSLESRGFITLYTEDLSVADQLYIFNQAKFVIAVHGAGLAPLLYSKNNEDQHCLIELLPCGHMTDVYRVISDQVGWRWIGVRGKIKPEYVSPAYDLEKIYTMHSLDDFEIDLKSLDLAFDIISNYRD